MNELRVGCPPRGGTEWQTTIGEHVMTMTYYDDDMTPSDAGRIQMQLFTVRKRQEITTSDNEQLQTMSIVLAHLLVRI